MSIKAEDRPNILWLFSDQHRAQAMSCAGDCNIETPHLDKLAADGIRFENAYSNTPLCSPFRASLYTGQYIHSHGVISLHRPLIPSAPQLAQVMKANGYFTSHIGKWHLSGGDVVQPYVSPYFRPGWDRWLGWEGSNRFFHTLYSEGEMPWKEDVDEQVLPGYQTDAVTDLTIEFIESNNAEAPWFHVMSFEPPHSPNIAPEPYMNMFADTDLVYRPNFDLDSERSDFYQNALRGYYAQIKNLDDNIGRIVDALEQSGCKENTQIWYFSDHGDYMGSHGRWQKGGPHEESSHIPLIVSQPAVLESGTKPRGLISGVDFMPTLLGYLGIDIPDTCQGTDLSELFSDPDSAGAEDVLIQFETPFHKEKPSSIYRALRHQRWLYVFYLHHPGGEYELFDLASDPYQLDNLIESPEYAETRAVLNQRLRELCNRTGDDFFERYSRVDVAVYPSIP